MNTHQTLCAAQILITADPSLTALSALQTVIPEAEPYTSEPHQLLRTACERLYPGRPLYSEKLDARALLTEAIRLCPPAKRS